MEKFNKSSVHRPLSYFFYGSLAVIILALSIGAYFLSSSFIQNEKKRAEISSVQVSQALASEHRYIVEEFFTNSYDSVFMRVSNVLQKFGSPKFEIYLFNTSHECLISKNETGSDIPCGKELKATGNQFFYSTDLKLGPTDLGTMRILVEDRFQFFTGSPIEFTLRKFAPVFLMVIILWGLWIVIAKRFILNPYYKKMVAIEKEKVSTDIVRQIIHDTKGEIAALDLLTYEIEDQRKADEIRCTLHNIREAFGNLGHHKEGIINSVREFPHDTRTLINDFIEQQRIKYKNHHSSISIISNLPHDSSKIMVDANTFYRVLSNLVENAVTAPNNHPKIKISIDVILVNDRVCISVVDNGLGIPEEVKRRLFEKGFTTKATGSGQGLSYVKKTVEDWGGKVSFRHFQEQGATFIIKIPIYTKPKVVILDDNTSLLFRYKKMIERYGNEAEVFADKETLFAKAQSFNSETIFLLDFNLADGTNGADVAKRLREIGKKKLYLHTGNPSLEKEAYPYIVDILSKGNFAETLGRLGIS